MNNDINNIKKYRENKTTESKNPLFAAKLPLLSLFFVIASLYIPAALYFEIPSFMINAMAIAVSAVSLIALIIMSESVRPVFSLILLVGCLGILGGNFLPGSFISCAFALVLSYTCVVMELWKKNKIIAVLMATILPLVPAAASAIIFPLGSFFIVILFIFAAVPMGLPLVSAMLKKLPRTSTVFRMTLSFMIYLMGAVALIIFLMYGNLYLDTLRGAFDSLRLFATDFFRAYLEQLSETAGTLGQELDLIDYSEQMATVLFNSLPATLTVITSCLAYFLHSNMIGAYYKPEDMTPEKKQEFMSVISFDVSGATAVIFMVSTIALLILNSADAEYSPLFAAATLNMSLILAPALCLTVTAFIRDLSTMNGPSCLGSIVYMLLLFLIFSFNLPIILLISFAGAVLIIVRDVRIGLKNKKKDI